MAHGTIMGPYGSIGPILKSYRKSYRKYIGKYPTPAINIANMVLENPPITGMVESSN